MKRTKPRTKVTNPVSSGTKNIATQTTEFDSFSEIARLQEQLKILHIENEVLRNHVAKVAQNGQITKSLRNRKSQAISVELTACGCKGNCSTKLCGCVKKNNKCNLSCKCSDKICQNQGLKENQENIDAIDTTIVKMQTSSGEDDAVNDITNNLGLFSPDESRYKNFEESQINNIYFSPDSVAFDLKKSNYQLLQKSPNHEAVDEKPENIDDKIHSQPHNESNPSELTIMSPEIKDITKEAVHWKQHIEQLIVCKKCKRTFIPHRIQKHEACCKDI